MKRKLPSLLALRYFEAVGRNLSFTTAARELYVTQAAVSHQVRLLEGDLQVSLLTRLHQRIELTAEGRRLLLVATECLDKLADVFSTMSAEGRSERIDLSVTPLISARWLMPRLGDFLAGEEKAEIIFHHSLEPPNEREARCDLKIFFSTVPLHDPAFDFLFTDALVPICTPALLRGLEGVTGEDLLSRLGIVHEFDHDWWKNWCRQSGMNEKTVERGIVLDDPAVLENAALLGRGIILGSMLFLKERLAEGELVLPFGTDQRIDIYYYVWDGSQRRRKIVTNFRKWLMCAGEAQRGRAEMDRISSFP